MRRRRAAPAVAALVALAAAACGGDDQPTGASATTAGPAASAAATATPTPTSTGPQELPSGELAPGTYATGTMRPPTTFRVGPGWEVQGELETGFALSPKSDTETVKAVAVTAIRWIITKPLITDGELRNRREQFVKPAPRDLVRAVRAEALCHPVPRIAREHEWPLGTVVTYETGLVAPGRNPAERRRTSQPGESAV